MSDTPSSGSSSCLRPLPRFLRTWSNPVERPLEILRVFRCSHLARHFLEARVALGVRELRWLGRGFLGHRRTSQSSSCSHVPHFIRSYFDGSSAGTGYIWEFRPCI